MAHKQSMIFAARALKDLAELRRPTLRTTSIGPEYPTQCVGNVAVWSQRGPGSF
jgi:hypothetical protein